MTGNKKRWEITQSSHHSFTSYFHLLGGGGTFKGSQIPYKKLGIDISSILKSVLQWKKIKKRTHRKRFWPFFLQFWVAFFSPKNSNSRKKPAPHTGPHPSSPLGRSQQQHAVRSNQEYTYVYHPFQVTATPTNTLRQRSNCKHGQYFFKWILLRNNWAMMLEIIKFARIQK